MPKVSVIVAVYNVEPYLRRSMDCLMNQTMQDLEFICVDDCSTDGSLTILREYEAKDNRFKIITSEENQGAAVARNKGLEIASGEYLGFIDPDDAIDLNYYEELYKKAKENDYDMVKCIRKTVLPDGTTITSHKNRAIRKNIYNFTYEWTTAIYRTRLINDNDINFPDECTKAQDVVFLNRVVLKANSVECIDNVFYYYFIRENSLDSSFIPLKSIVSACLARKLMIQDLNNSRLFEKNKRQYGKKYHYISQTVFYTLFQNNSQEARQACAENLIELFDLCLDKKIFVRNASHPRLFKLATTRDVAKLSKVFYSIPSRENLDKNYCKFIQKIFAIRNSFDKTHKIITILGFNIKIKRKQ